MGDLEQLAEHIRAGLGASVAGVQHRAWRDDP